MGSCFSKKNEGSSSSSLGLPGAVANGSAASVAVVDPSKCSSNVTTAITEKMETVQKVKKKMGQKEEVKMEKEEDEGVVKKEIFVIKHRKSHDRERDRRSPPQHNVDAVDAAMASSSSTSNDEMVGNNNNNNNVNVNGGCNGVVRTSSCTKEEVDAILIQCGRLSRSNSSGKTASSGRKYSGSKRSYDFDHNDHENGRDDVAASDEFDTKRRGNDYEDDEAAERRQHRHRHRQSGRPSPGRRRTPSREREQQQQQRSGSRERANNNGGGRRVSRSPGRRSENTNNSTTTMAGTNAGTGNNVNSTARPGKMVSVPATISSLVMDKSNNGVTAAISSDEPATIKRISVKRNACEATAAGSRSAASPRSKSPARTHANGNGKGSTENQQPQPALSRSSSRKAEQSPYRRNPLSEIDPNSLAYPPSAGNKASCNTNNNSRASTNVQNQKPNPEITNKRGVAVAEAKPQAPINGNNATVTTSVAEGLQKPQTLTRTRSARRSRDLDINPETLLNPIPSYTTLLLEDIQNFHQKNTVPFSLPACVTKACSILEAVADLNSTTSSNLSCAISEHDRKCPPPDQYSRNDYNFCSGNNIVGGKKVSEGKDPFVESEVLVRDELMEPSFHKYVTVRRGGGGDDMEEQESSGSNSFAGSIVNTQNWGFSSSSSIEPNSADSTDRWTSRSNTREQRDQSPLRLAGCEANENRRGVSGNRRDYDLQQNGIGRGGVGGNKSIHSVPLVAAAAAATT